MPICSAGCRDALTVSFSHLMCPERVLSDMLVRKGSAGWWWLRRAWCQHRRMILPSSCRACHVRVTYRAGDGGVVETTLDRVAVGDVAGGLPVREFRWYKGRRHYSGWYWSATTGRLVAYESRLELARIMLADFDPLVTAIAAQPFLLAGPRKGHLPALLRRSLEPVQYASVLKCRRAAAASRPGQHAHRPGRRVQPLGTGVHRGARRQSGRRTMARGGGP